MPNTKIFHLIQPSPDGEGAARAVKLALKRAGLSSGDIDYINAHGTATLLNDRTESTVIKSVFGDKAKSITVSASKSMMGHLLGAAGGIESVISVLAINNGMVPPTINLTHPDPECDLDYVPNDSRKKNVETILSNSFAFGGQNASILVKKFQ